MKRSIAPIACAALLAAAPAFAQAPGYPADYAGLVEAGRKEAKVVVYATTDAVAANPLITLFGLTVGNLLGASLLIEVVMSWPGLGPLFLEAILARDLMAVIGVVMFSTVALIIGMLASDALLYAADPRIRVES